MIGFMSNRIEWDEPQPAKRVTLLTTDAATAASTVCCAIDYATPQDLAAAGYVPIPPAPQGEREDDDSPTCEVPGCQYDARYCADHMTVADAENMKEQEMKHSATIAALERDRDAAQARADAAEADLAMLRAVNTMSPTVDAHVKTLESQHARDVERMAKLQKLVAKRDEIIERAERGLRPSTGGTFCPICKAGAGSIAPVNHIQNCPFRGWEPAAITSRIDPLESDVALPPSAGSEPRQPANAEKACGEVAWLIEAPGPKYLHTVSHCYEWTYSVDDAMRCSSKRQAESILATALRQSYPVISEGAAVEHMWISPPKPLPAPTAPDAVRELVDAFDRYEAADDDKKTIAAWSNIKRLVAKVRSLPRGGK